ALLKLLEKISEAFVWIFSNIYGWFLWIHKNFIKYCDGSCCCGGARSSIYQDQNYQDQPPPYSPNDELQIPANVQLKA
ncbi:31125_t:CDS:1, partial [Gigaspora margarita]